MIRCRPARTVAATSMMAAALLAVAGLTGCTPSTALSPWLASRPSPSPVIPLATGMSVPGTGWVTVAVGTGGPTPKYWQLLVRDPVSGRWQLATPPVVPGNVGLAVAGQPLKGLTVGFLPVRLFRYTQLDVSRGAGQHWSPSLLPAGLVAEPDALVRIEGGRLLAATGVDVEESNSGAVGWRPVVTLRTLAATPAGLQCGLTALTGVATGFADAPIVAGTCSNPGRLGLFIETSKGWQATGPRLPSSLSAQSVSVLGLASTAQGDSMLIGVQTSRGELIMPASRSGSASAWSVYPQLGTAVSQVESVASNITGTWAISYDGGHGLLTTPPMSTARPSQSAKPGKRRSKGKHVGSNQHSKQSARLAVKLPAADAILVPGTAPYGPGGPTALVPMVDSVVVYQLSKRGTWQRSRVISAPPPPPPPMPKHHQG